MSLGSYAVFYAEKIKRELETLRKKKQHLDGLLDGEKISKSTYDYFAKNLDDEIVERGSQQKTEADTITLKLKELEQNTKKLELCLAEIELKHIAAEIDADLYERESKILTLGIENARRELNNTRTALFKLFPELMPKAATTEIEEEKVKEVEELDEVPAEETVEVPSPEEEAEEPAVKETTTEETTEAAEASAEAEEQEATEEPATETEQKKPGTWNRPSTKKTRWWEG